MVNFCGVHISSTFVTGFGKTDHFDTSEMHFIAPYHRYNHTLSKYSDKTARDSQVCFSTQLFLAMPNTEKSVQMVWDLYEVLIGCRSSPRQLVTGVVTCLAYGWSWGCLWLSIF